MEKIFDYFNKFRKNAWSIVDPADDLSEKNKIGMEIFMTGLNDDNNLRFLNIDDSGLDAKKYIVSKDFFMNDDVETFITFTVSPNGRGSYMTAVNHTYSYDFEFPSKTTRKMNNMFYEAVRRDRQKMENSINKNITGSLNTVLLEFQKRQQANAKIVDDNEKIK